MTMLATRLAPSGEAQSLREALTLPETWNEADRSVDIVWTTGAAVTRFDWYDGGYYEETLSVEPKHVRLDRMNDGGPVLLDHIASTRTLAGSIVPGSARMVDGKGVARIRLAGTPDMADTVGKVRDGHLRTVSVGYAVYRYERTEGERGERDTMHATDWEPLEISLTPVPADAGAIIRTRSVDMPEVIEPDQPPERRDNRSVYRNGNPSRNRSVTEEQILRACSRANLGRDFERGLIDDHEREPMTEAQLYRAVADRLIEDRAAPQIDPRGEPRTDERTRLRTAFGDTLYARLAGSEVPEHAREYAGASIVDMARALLEHHGERARWMRPHAVIDAALRYGAHTTSDFALILDTAARRYLLNAFSSAESPLRQIARKRDFQDFRTRFAIQADGPPLLRNVQENAEFKRVTFTEKQNGYSLGTYGEIFSISRQALINDDLGVFAQMGMFWGRAQAETEASYFAASIAGNGLVLTSDSKTLYHADHGNLAASGSAINVTALSEGRQMLRNMKNADGVTAANVVPKYLVVGPAKETEAEQALAALAATQVANVNPFSGKLELIVDPRLTGNSWRLFADPALNPVLEYGNLEGQDGLFTDTRTGFEIDGVDFKARIDIGVGVIDYKGSMMNPGN